MKTIINKKNFYNTLKYIIQIYIDNNNKKKKHVVI